MSSLGRLLIAVLLVLVLPACEREDAMSAKTIEEAQEELTGIVMSLDGVVGTGIGETEAGPCITVFVSQESPELLKRIPSTHGGFNVVVEETGELRIHEEDG